MDPCLAHRSIDSLTPGGVSAQTLSDALAGRIAGVSVMRSSGVIGTGSRVRVRGGSGLLIPREPILIIDGVRVDASQSSFGVSVGGQAPSRLDDIPLHEIERITVLHGPASTALYGANAAGGVIVVTTKGSRGGEPRWESWADGGVVTDVTEYPANFGTGPPTYGQETCTRADAALGSCTPGLLSQWNPLEQASPFRTARRWTGGTSVTGGARWLQYYAGGSVQGDQGVLEPNDARKWTGRLNLDATPVRTLQLSLRGSHLASGTTFPVGDLFGIGALQAGLAGNTADDQHLRGYFGISPATIATVGTKQHVTRSLGSAAASWTPLQWLTARGLIGREVVRRDDSQTTPMAVAFLDNARSGPWRIEGSAGRDKHTTIGGHLAAVYPIARSLRGATTLGAERLTQTLRTRDSAVTFFEDGRQSGHSLRTARERRKSTGLFAAQQVVWADRRILDVSVRRDGKDRSRLLDAATYWSTSASWAVGAEPFFPRVPGMSALRLRAAYGVAGDTRPPRVAMDGPFTVPPPTGPAPGPPGFIFSPEKVSELEVGAEVGAWHNRVILDGTWFRQRSTNAVDAGCCIGPLAFSDEGAWHTSGVELTLTTALLRTIATEWDARLTFAALSNRYDRSTGGPRLVDRSTFFEGPRRMLMPGYPIAGTWGPVASAHDANGDGVIVPSEVTLTPERVYLGPGIPTRQAGLATTVKLSRDRVILSMQMDYHGGHLSRNVTEEYRCDVNVCAALYDPGAPVADQTRAVLTFGEGSGFAERADFVRLREVGVTWVLFPGWSHRNRIGALSLTVAGRNLATFTSYSGLDPEINTAGQTSFGTTELFTLPLPRTFLIRFALERCSLPAVPSCR